MSPARAASNALLRRWCAPIEGRVLSLGSSSDQDGAGSTYRQYFSHAAAYVTSELAPHPHCDLVLDARALTLADGSFDAVFCSGVLEHVDDCHAAVAEIRRVLVPGGVALIGVPFQQAIHRAPQDFWRFTEYGVRWLLRACASVEIVPIGDDPKFPWSYWVRAVK